MNLAQARAISEALTTQEQIPTPEAREFFGATGPLLRRGFFGEQSEPAWSVTLPAEWEDA